MTDHERWMLRALELADEAAAAGEVPVGCVIVRGDAIIGEGRNRREEAHSALAHAEIAAIHTACSVLDDWRLSDCGIYVTLEPCPMCAGAILNARMKWLCYGARDEKTGSCGSVLNLFEENYGHRPAIYGGILEKECLARIQDFFRFLRQ